MPARSRDSRRLIFEPLEGRVLLSADGLALPPPDPALLLAKLDALPELPNPVLEGLPGGVPTPDAMPLAKPELPVPGENDLVVPQRYVDWSHEDVESTIATRAGIADRQDTSKNFSSFDDFFLIDMDVLDATDLTLRASQDASGELRVGVYDGTDLLESRLLKDIGQIIVNGSDGDDTLTVDFSTPFSVSGGISFAGGFQASASGDSLNIEGSPASSSVAFTGSDETGFSGWIDVDGTVVSFTGLEPVFMPPMPDLVLSLTPGVANTDATLQDSASFIKSRG